MSKRSMKQWVLTSVFAAVAWSTASDVRAAEAEPQVIAHEGRMSDAAGKPLRGFKTVTFNLYNAKVGGAAIWSETVEVEFDDGHYDVWLGQAAPLDASLLDGKTRWLGVSVGAARESGKRAAVASTPHPMFVQGDSAPKAAPHDDAPRHAEAPTAAPTPTEPARPAGVVLSAAFADAPLAPLTHEHVQAFIGATVGLTVAPTQLVLVSASAGLGSTAPGGATDLHLSICTRRVGSQSLLDNRGTRLENLTIAENSRQTFALKTRFAGLAPGEYEVGLCGYVKGSAARWNNNDTSRVAVMVTAG